MSFNLVVDIYIAFLVAQRKECRATRYISTERQDDCTAIHESNAQSM